MPHETGVDCPEDFGLEATLEEAERQGWRRCYKCRALVELTVGCRHITCKCRAQFCYTCGARWRTCSCSEVDQERRQREVAERRVVRNERSREEEEDVARAIAAIEEMERREAEERDSREELQRAIEARERRRREHHERLEAEKRRLEEEEAARRREEAIRTSVNERENFLGGVLLEIQQFQQSSLISRHNSEIAALNEEIRNQQAVEKAELDSLQIKLDSNSALRRNLLLSVHASAVTELTSRHEAEEDDTFMSMQEHLRGKPNRDVRIKAVLDKLQQRQKVELEKLSDEHGTRMELLARNVLLERHALEMGHTLHSAGHDSKSNEAMNVLSQTVALERKWFEAVTERRRVMIEELRQRLWSDSGVDRVAASAGREEEYRLPSSKSGTVLTQKHLTAYAFSPPNFATRL